MSTPTMIEPTTDRTAREPGASQAPGVPPASARIAARLGDDSITVLRVSLGLVFLAFGLLKFVPGASPAEALAIRTVDALTLGLVSDGAALLVTAIVETFIGISLVSGRFLRTGLAVLGASMVGILSPLVLFFGDLFPGNVSLEAQYVFKDIVLVAAGLVIAARTVGARHVAP